MSRHVAPACGPVGKHKTQTDGHEEDPQSAKTQGLWVREDGLAVRLPTKAVPENVPEAPPPLPENVRYIPHAPLCSPSLLLFIYFYGYWGLNSGPCAMTSALPLEPHHPALFAFSCFLGRVLCFLPGLVLDLEPPAYASPAVEIIGMHHHA
jgi:hypothetical protein